jgi:hypothetical protein
MARTRPARTIACPPPPPRARVTGQCDGEPKKRQQSQDADNLLDHDDLVVGGIEGLDLLRVLGSRRQRNHRRAE